MEKYKFHIQAILLLVIASNSALAETYVVQSGDSLWKIAASLKTPDTSIHQMIAAIHSKNTNVLGNDIGTIKPGMVLQIPTSHEAMAADSKSATVLLSTGVEQSKTQMTRNERINNIHIKIAGIEKQVQGTLEALQASNTAYQSMLDKEN